MAQVLDSPHSITILKHEVEVVHELRVPWLDPLRHFFSGLRAKQQSKAATAISSLTKRVWSNKKLTKDNKIQIYRACVLSILLYGTES